MALFSRTVGKRAVEEGVVRIKRQQLDAQLAAQQRSGVRGNPLAQVRRHASAQLRAIVTWLAELRSVRVNAPPHTVSCFQYSHACAASLQVVRSCEA